jgi:plasmid stability protein
MVAFRLHHSENDMASVTVKNLPAEVHERLKSRAAAHGRSLNAEILAVLKAAVVSERVDAEALLARARELREGVKGRLTDAELRRMRESGRP